MQLQTLDLGRVSFSEAFAFQETLAASRRRDECPDTLLIAEHDPVYTLGRHADPANVLFSEAELKVHGIQVVRTNRGGQVTYHGPGQIVGYPIIRLSRAGKGVAQYVAQLETMLIRVLARFGVIGKTDSINPGVWIGLEKVAALGIRVAGRVTTHGFSLNVNTALEDYQGIYACGIRSRGVTSLHLHRPGLTPSVVKPVLIETFKSVFGYPME